MKGKSLIWKIPVALTGAILGIVLLLLIAVGAGVYVDSVRSKIVEKGVAVANEKTGWDIDLGRLYLSPFHHSPKVLYRAYKGKEDLPIRVEIDSLFVGHRGVDTLVYTRALHLSALVRTTQAPPAKNDSSFIIPPIQVDYLHLENTTFHSDSLIKTVGVDAIVGLLETSSPEILIAEGKYPLHGLRIHNADVGIDLRPDTLAPPPPTDSVAPLRLA